MHCLQEHNLDAYSSVSLLSLDATHANLVAFLSPTIHAILHPYTYVFHDFPALTMLLHRSTILSMREIHPFLSRLSLGILYLQSLLTTIQLSYQYTIQTGD
eukprot:TRINITY_DN3462_c0_g1_i7.p1 TRINITY_DN3462_c0_g1~~TRINITY_DN3462_c0_g1_i7.p1  ORF type:complete len:101 (+),score=4.95 TRINITY_DN3462_c0_g1_i7:546-848(+)